MDTLKPANITANRQTHRLIIVWNDGHTSDYSFSLLRFACPCAECRGGHEFMSSEPDPQVFSYPEEDTPATQLKNIEAVGSYAISIEWEDGHHFGIYNWYYLRALCPCPICRNE
jgi:DUF971 family protein